MAPKRRYIDRKLLKELCQAQLTGEEIAACLRCSWDTLERRYAVAIKAWRSSGPGSARRRLYKLGMEDNAKGKPNTAALIFFLKNYGGMRDVVETKEPIGRGNLPSHFGSSADNASGTHKPN